MKLRRHCNLMMSTEPTVVDTESNLSHVSREKCVPGTHTKPGFDVKTVGFGMGLLKLRSLQRKCSKSLPTSAFQQCASQHTYSFSALHV